VRSIGTSGPAVAPSLDLGPHLVALVTTLADMCGLPPEVPGVVVLPTSS
jgi:hypothetical protein